MGISTKNKGLTSNMLKYILFALLLFFSMNGIAPAAENDTFEVEAEGSYPIVANGSIDLAKRMALFAAKRKAVASAGRYLSREDLIEVDEADKDEIYSLTAREIHSEILEEKQETVGEISTYRVRIRASIRPSDFIKAKISDNKQEKNEATKSFYEEMEQPVSAKIDPGKDIAKAYRLLRKKQWRIAMIYLNHLEKKYANWDEIYMAKALVYYVLHETVFMKRALSKACHLNNQIACDDLKNLKRIHEHDFGLLITD
jgi:hypothetical protein